MAAAIIQDILSTFKANSKEEWEAKALTDLKGKSIEDISWQLNEAITLSPYYSASDNPQSDTSALKKHNPDWQVGEHYEVSDYKASNELILHDLMHGLTAPSFSFKNTPSVEDLNTLFKEVGLEHIHTHFNSEDGELYLNWMELVKARGIKAAAYFQLESPIAVLSKSVHIDASSQYKGEAAIHEELKNTLLLVKGMLNQAADAHLLAKQMQFTFFVDNAYLVNIAKIRAFKLLWLNLMKELGLSVMLPFISVQFAPDAYGEDEQDNLIKATSMAMSAVLGGADHLIVRPTSNTSRAKRLARNVQLILKNESGLNQVADPAQGSYYIESLTNKLVNYCY